MPNANEGVAQQKLSFIAAGNTKWQFSSFLQNWTYSYCMIQQSLSFVFIKMEMN